jgi:hypothetical protein
MYSSLVESEDRPTDDGCLVMTAVTLVKPSRVELAMTALLALRANESVRPAPPIQCPFTLLLGTVRVQGHWETEALLELHRILRHGKILLPYRQSHYIQTAGSVADLRQ